MESKSNLNWVEVDTLIVEMGIGVFDWEKETLQKVEIDLKLACDFQRAAQSDDLRYTIDYSKVAEFISNLAASKHFNLLEHFAQKISDLLFIHFSVDDLTITLRKPGAIPNAKTVGITIYRSRASMSPQNVYLSLGSNIDREANISSAMKALKGRYSKLRSSKVYESEAVGFEGASFYNSIVEIETNESIGELTAYLKGLEDQRGRDRNSAKFSSRTLDIDIVAYGSQVGTFNGIELPRPELFYNAFVLLPMSELVPDLIEPKSGQNYSSLWDEFTGDQKLWPVDFIA